MNYGELSQTLLSNVRNQKPLIHTIMNFVAMNFVANALLACGASPVMAHAYNEVEEMTSIAQALVLNIGTLDEEWIQSMIIASKVAARKKIPVVLDPVGAGATQLRTHTALKLLNTGNVSVLRGNPSEILALHSRGFSSKGVDAIHTVEEVIDTAKAIAQQYQVVVAVTGETDIVTDGTILLKIHNGHRLMQYVTGTGCVASSLVGAFCAVSDNYLAATAVALSYFGVAGELAAKRVLLPGSFMIRLLDELYAITPRELEYLVSIECVCGSNNCSS